MKAQPSLFNDPPPDPDEVLPGYMRTPATCPFGEPWAGPHPLCLAHGRELTAVLQAVCDKVGATMTVVGPEEGRR